MTMPAIYIATSLDNWKAHNELSACFERQGWYITHDWTRASPWVKDQGRERGLFGAEAHTQAEQLRVAGTRDLYGVEDADVVVVLLPGGKGTHTEMGAALALGKPVVLVGTEQQVWGSEEAYTCAFYHLPIVHRVVVGPGDIVEELVCAAVHTALQSVKKEQDGRVMQACAGLNTLCDAAYQNAVDKGFHDNPTGTTRDEVTVKLMLIVSELSEALEELRNGRRPDELYHVEGKPEGVPAELADAVIRIADLCGSQGVDLGDAVLQKMRYNRSRPYKHGRKF